MKKSTYIILAIIIIVLAVVLVKNNKPKVSTANPIKIGAVLSLTGVAAPWGEYAQNGINLAVKMINDNGGINGREVVVAIENDNTDPKQAVSAYDKLVSVDKVQGVIGGVFDFVTQPLIPLALTNKLTFISPSNFYISGGFELNDQSFVMLTEFNQTIKKLTPYITNSSIKKLAVVHFQSTFGGEISKTLDGVMKDLGRAGVIDEAYNQIGNNDFRTTIIKLKNEGVDAVFLDMVGNDPLNFLTQAKQLGFAPTIMTYNSALDAFANETDKSPLEGVVFLNWEITTPQFASLYQNAYGITPTKSADKYFDAVYVLAQSIANSADSSQASAYMAKNTFKTPNSSSIAFTSKHSVQDTLTKVQIMKNGTLVEWQK